jgi:hypothetical protein
MPNNESQKGYTQPGSKYDPEGSKIPQTPEKRVPPQWYTDNRDEYPELGDELKKREELESEGFVMNDQDRSRTSHAYNEAVMNNSFAEDSIRKTLRDFHGNSYHKLISNSMDNVSFNKWEGYITDAKVETYPEYFSIRLPWNIFVYQSRRDKFKVSQFYHRWLAIEEIANNRDVFGFMLLMFVDQRAFTDFEVWVEEQYVVVRFPYQPVYVERNYPIYLYKFDTLYSSMIKISRALVEDQWGWVVPLDHIGDIEIREHKKVITAFTRTEGEMVGDNLEFLDVDLNGDMIDISGITEFNKDLISGSFDKWVWMTIVVPKFMHEYSQLLPTDLIYRPYVHDLKYVSIEKNAVSLHVKVGFYDPARGYTHDQLKPFTHDELSAYTHDQLGGTDMMFYRNVFVDYNDFYQKDYDGWTHIMRPIVLSESGHVFPEVYELTYPEIEKFLELTFKFQDDLNLLMDYWSKAEEDKVYTEFAAKLDVVEASGKELYTFMGDFLDTRVCPRYAQDEVKWKDFFQTIVSSRYFAEEYDFPAIFFDDGRFLIDRMHFLINKFDLGDTVRKVQKKILWQYPTLEKDEIRYYRPISETDFWIFQYDPIVHTWRPVSKEVVHHYPDAYMLQPIGGGLEDPAAVFKAFFFYSDTINTKDIIDEAIDNIPQYDAEFEAHSHKQGYVFDIFIRKFYWLALDFVYPKLMLTGSKWELLEYVIDNLGYRRYNKLFFNTLEPHYKLGLATYLKSSNAQFVFDDAISKMREAIQLKWHEYDKVNAYQQYLDTHWAPSYFDYIIRILDEIDIEYRNLYRHDLMFSVRNVRRQIQRSYDTVHNTVNDYNQELDEIVAHLQANAYAIDLDLVDNLKIMLVNLDTWLLSILTYIDRYDMPIVSLKEINWVLDEIKSFSSKVDAIAEATAYVQQDIIGADVVVFKVSQLFALEKLTQEELEPAMGELEFRRNSVKLTEFVQSALDVVTNFDNFEYHWSYALQDIRMTYLKSVWDLMNFKNLEDVYGMDGVRTVLDMMEIIETNRETFLSEIKHFWDFEGKEHDAILLDLFETSRIEWSSVMIAIPEYVLALEKLTDVIASCETIMKHFDTTKMNVEEFSYYDSMNISIGNVLHESRFLNGSHDLMMYNEYGSIQFTIIFWLEYLGIEANVFEAIRDLIELSTVRVQVFEFIRNKEFSILIQYLSETNESFVPDPERVDHLSYYKPTKSSMVPSRHGIHYAEDALLFTSGMGVFKVTNRQELDSISAIAPASEFYNVYFKEPKLQRLFYTLTQEEGIDGFMKCDISKRVYIINDEVAVSTVSNILSIVSDVTRLCNTVNPYMNNDVIRILNRIPEVSKEWIAKQNRYGNNMTPEIKDAINRAMPHLYPFAEATKELIEIRTKIDLPMLLQTDRIVIDRLKATHLSVPWEDPNIQMLFKMSEKTYESIVKFYDNGRGWDDVTELDELIKELELRLVETRGLVGHQPPVTGTYVNTMKVLVKQVEIVIQDIKTNIPLLKPLQKTQAGTKLAVENILLPLDHEKIQGDEWFAIYETFIAESGSGYEVGDIVVATDLKLLFQVIRIDTMTKEVLQVRPLAYYALHELVWGYFKTECLVGYGTGLSIDIHSKSVKDDGAGVAKDSFIPDPDQYRNQDLMMFPFQNIHDLDIHYEVFAGGIQIVDFEQRHEDNDPLLSRKLDMLYINSNIISNLKNSHLYIKPDQYFVYKIDGFNIKDPGAGFHVKQDVFVDGKHFCMKLNISRLVYHPYKGIEAFDLIDGSLIYDRLDPGATDCPTVPDVQNNIDDEYHVSMYDALTTEGRPRPLAFRDEERYDDLEHDDRNAFFQYRPVQLPEDKYPLDQDITDGDPLFHYYLGDRYDMLGDEYDRWLGLVDVEDLVHHQIADEKRQPPNQPISTDFQLIKRLRIWNTGPTPVADFEVDEFDKRPFNIVELPEIKQGDKLAVTIDEMHENHRWIYIAEVIDERGNIFYDRGIIADGKWNFFEIDWMQTDSYSDRPTISAQYPTIDWMAIPDHDRGLDLIEMRLHERLVNPTPKNKTTYITKMTADDISVFNWTLKIWEDLKDEERWRLDVWNDDLSGEWGFRLTFLMDGIYDYNMKLYLNKTPAVQQRNQLLVRPAIVDIYSSIIDEVIVPEERIEVNTSRATRIRKLFPYEQREGYSITPGNKEMIFDFHEYAHYKNEIHMEDIVIFNKTANRFEDPMNHDNWEIQIKDPRRNDRGIERFFRVKSLLILKPGESYKDGLAFGWNEDLNICLFGEVVTDLHFDGAITKFKYLHCVNHPDNGEVEFMIYQYQSQAIGAKVLVSFETTDVNLFETGYVYGVDKMLAPIAEGFKLIPKFKFSGTLEYEISIQQTTTRHLFMEPDWLVTPTWNIPGKSFPSDRLYILINKRRFPLLNPSTKRPTLEVNRESWGTSVQFMNLYKKWEHFEIRSVPYPTRSIYVQRKIPKHGYINLTGKINKPLDKKHFEFWVNGKLLYDEVNIITPTKFFMHGLTSLKNLEILEINRDYNEYFSDDLLSCQISEDNIPIPVWNLRTYLDDVLEGALADNNYSLEEQEQLITPIWKQIARDHPEYKDYPDNIDSDRDILLRVYTPEDLPLPTLPGGSYQYLVIDAPTIEGYALDHRNLKWERTGWKPITLQTITDMLNEIFVKEIKEDPYFTKFYVISEDMWYGTTAIMYDELGLPVFDPSESLYQIYDDSLVRIDAKNHEIDIEFEDPEISFTDYSIFADIDIP